MSSWNFYASIMCPPTIASFPGSHSPECKHWNCAGVKSLVFSHVRSSKGREELCEGIRILRTGKKAKISGNLLHVSNYWALNNIHTKRWNIVGWTMRKMLPFCFGPIWITSCLCRKDTRLSLRYIFEFQESLGTRLPQQSSLLLYCRTCCLTLQ